MRDPAEMGPGRDEMGRPRPELNGKGGDECGRGVKMTYQELRDAIDRIGRDRKAFADQMVEKVEDGTATEDDWNQARHFQHRSRFFEQLKENQLFG